MTNFNIVNVEDADQPTQELLAAIDKELGMIPNVYAVMANSPSTLAGFLGFGKALDSGSLSAVLKEKIALVVSNENTCGYCVSAHSAVAAQLGMSAEDAIDAQKGKSENTKEQAVLNLAISLNSNHGHGDNSAVRKAFDAGLSVEEIIEVLGQVLKNIMTNTLNGIAETKIDFPKKKLI